MHLEWITDLHGFLRLREPWNELLSRTDADHAFMTHEWFEAWIKNLGDPNRICLGAAWSDGQLAAVAPMQLKGMRVRGIPVRALSFLSSGVSPRCGFILHPDGPAESLFRPMLAKGDWDVAILKNLPTDAAASQRFLSFLETDARGSHFVEGGRRSPYLRTEGDFETYWKSRSRSLRQSLRTSMNRLKRDDRSHEIEKIEDGEVFSELFDGLLETSGSSWKGGLQTDLASRRDLQGLYLDFSRTCPGRFETWILRIDGEIAGFDYYLRGPRALSLIRTDFDPRYEFYSPGNCLRMLTLQDLFSRPEVWEYDTGGRAYAYKTKWTDRIREHVDVVAGAGTGPGRLLVQVWKAAKKMKSVLQKPAAERAT
jgi:CelD/BcsL family acetyltransferase involved in cellulose biosynthesis